MKVGIQKIPIHLLVYKGWLKSEMRVRIIDAKVKQYAEEKAKGMLFPPPVVFFSEEDEIYRVGDGFHRILAEEKNGSNKIEVNLRPGLLKEAVLFNLKANREGQGLLFSHGDFTKAVKFMLESKEFKGWTNRQIAEAVGCTFGLVSRVTIKFGFARKKNGRRPAIEPETVMEKLRAGATCEQIAEELKVSPRTVYRRVDASCYETCPTCKGTGRVLKDDDSRPKRARA